MLFYNFLKPQIKKENINEDDDSSTSMGENENILTKRIRTRKSTDSSTEDLLLKKNSK